MKDKIKKEILNVLPTLKFPQGATDKECDEILAERVAVVLDGFFRGEERRDNTSSNKRYVVSSGSAITPDKEITCTLKRER